MRALENELAIRLSFQARHFTADHFEDSRKARAAFEQLCEAGVLQAEDVVAVPATEVEHLHTHHPGEDLDCESLADQLRRRWRAAQPKPIRLYFASPKTIQRLGGDMPGRIKQLDAVSHDNGAAAMFLAFLAADPALADAWVPEERIPERYGVVHPDALLADASGPRMIAEFAGQYSAERLRDLSSYSDSEGLPLTLWTIAEQEET